LTKCAQSARLRRPWRAERRAEKEKKMRQVLFAAALSINGVAFAQAQTSDTSAQQQSTQPADNSAQTASPSSQTQQQADERGQTAQQPGGQTVNDPSQASGQAGVTQQGTDPNGQANPPAGTDQMPTQGTSPARSDDSSGAMPPRATTTDYPPCSRTVTDSCVQTYERGVRRRPRR
jgi:hypothetical protein